MFKSFLKKDLDIEIYSPINGEIVSLDKVPDPIFNQRMMGDGVAINPKEGKVFAPIDGEIIQIPQTKHAIGIRSKEGLEILVHIGLETVSLKGKGFKTFVDTGNKVSRGQILMEFDLEYIQENSKSCITPVVITNAQELDLQYIITDKNMGEVEKTIIITFFK